jgi:hypothetical protein
VNGSHNGGDDAQTTSYQTPFGREMDRRNAYRDGLPGRKYRDWFEALNRASRVYGGNSAELDRHFQQFVGTPMFVSEFPEDFGFEAARLLHNYLAGLASLRDVQKGNSRRSQTCSGRPSWCVDGCVCRIGGGGRGRQASPRQVSYT